MDGIQTFSAGDVLTEFSSVFSTMFTLITGNPALLIILCVAVGVPVVGAIMALFKR